MDLLNKGLQSFANQMKKIKKYYNKIICYIFDESTAIWVHIPEIINTNRLVYPFRYDIIMRQRFLTFYDDNKELYFRNREKFLKKSQQQPYYRYFIGIEGAQNQLKKKYGNDLSVEKLFEIRVDNFVYLYESIIKNGFSNKRKRRISLKCPFKVDSIEKDRNEFFIGNGCHRLAVLRHLYGNFLSRKFFRRRYFSTLRIVNTTAILAQNGLLSSQELNEISLQSEEISFITSPSNCAAREPFRPT